MTLQSEKDMRGANEIISHIVEHWGDVPCGLDAQRLVNGFIALGLPSESGISFLTISSILGERTNEQIFPALNVLCGSTKAILTFDASVPSQDIGGLSFRLNWRAAISHDFVYAEKNGVRYGFGRFDSHEARRIVRQLKKAWPAALIYCSEIDKPIASNSGTIAAFYLKDLALAKPEAKPDGEG